MAEPPASDGVMDARYAEERRSARHVVWRYRVRARFAAEGFRARRGDVRGPRVIELGAAEGRTLLELRRLLGPDGRYDGFELSESLLAAAPALPDNAALHAGDACDLGAAADGGYDLCAALAILEHLPDPGACVREAFRALAPGGVFVATCPHPMWDEIAGALRLVADEHHEQHMTGDRMRELAVAAGFEGVEVAPFMWAPVGALSYAGITVDPARALRWDRWLGRRRWLRAGFVNQGLVARKPG